MNRRITRILITGTGRCGTQWIARALTTFGLHCQHEQAFSPTSHGGGAWKAEASWCAAPYLDRVGPETYVVHLVRDPLKVIASRAAWGTFKSIDSMESRRLFAIEHCPEILVGRNAIERSAIHYVSWNELIRNPDERLRIEDTSSSDIERLVSKIIPPVNGRGVLPRRDLNTAGSSLHAITWADVEHVPGLVSMAKGYGYA